MPEAVHPQASAHGRFATGTECGACERRLPHHAHEPLSRVLPSHIEARSATRQKSMPTGRWPAAATLVHSSSHFMSAGSQPFRTRKLKPSEASYLPSERQKILGVVFAPVTPSGYSASASPATSALMLWAARWPFTSAVCPSFSSRLLCDIMSPMQKMFEYPVICRWSFTVTESRKPKADAKGVLFSSDVLGITPTHLYTTPASRKLPEFRVMPSCVISAMASPSRSSTFMRWSQRSACSAHLAGKPGSTVGDMSTIVTLFCGNSVRISPASSTPTAPAPTMMTFSDSLSLLCAVRQEARRCESEGSEATGLIGSW
mmetsp:Transcript_79217/g.232603  ORF Transcript_79217/g.232603 Transcript_79217/m.232603 type:complete len:316 (+) Transcript_79217:81-1028(+)